MPDYSSQPTPEGGTSARAKPENSDAWLAMRWVACFWAADVGGKTTAYVLTGASAILADAAESVVHVVAVGFAAACA